MKRFLAASTAALLVVAVGATSVAAAPNVKYRTFGSADVTEGPTGTFTIVADGIDPTYGGAEYGGVYLNSRSVSGKRIGSVTFSFKSSGDVAGGAPRFSIPINTGTGRRVAFFAFLDVNGCGGDTFVSTSNSSCTVYAGSETFANWAAFAAAHPRYRIAPGRIPFIIADGSDGTFVVSEIVLR